MAGDPTACWMIEFVIYVNDELYKTYGADPTNTARLSSILETNVGLDLSEYKSEIDIYIPTNMTTLVLDDTISPKTLSVYGDGVNNFQVNVYLTKDEPNPTISQIFMDGVTYDLKDKNAGSGLPEGGTTGQVLTMSGGIEARGPAPDGYHVPTVDEWQAVFDMGVALGQWSSGNGNGIRIKLKMPFAGYRSRSAANVNGQGSNGGYWSSTAYSADYAYLLYFNSSSLNPQLWNYRAYGFSVRCFRNSPLQPSSSWTTIYAGSNGAGIYHNPTKGVISISSDGQTWITIADKNLGATTVYNDGDTLSQANCGNYYQWGNNYSFPWAGTISKKSGTAIDASAYGKGNPYSSDTWITVNPWDSSDNKSLWGTEVKELNPQWKDIEALPEGGTAGQVLTKTDDGAEWQDSKGKEIFYVVRYAPQIGLTDTTYEEAKQAYNAGYELVYKYEGTSGERTHKLISVDHDVTTTFYFGDLKNSQICKFTTSGRTFYDIVTSSSITQISKVDSLPTSPDANTLYFITA